MGCAIRKGVDLRTLQEKYVAVACADDGWE